MTVIKDYVSGAEKPADKGRHKKLMDTLILLANAKLNDNMSWKYYGAVCVTDEELAEAVFGPHYIPATVTFVRRWILQAAGKRKEDAQALTDELPNKVLIRVTDYFVETFYNRYERGKKEKLPKVYLGADGQNDETELRLSMNCKGGAVFGFLICDDSHPMNRLADQDYINRTTKAQLVAEARKAKPAAHWNGKSWIEESKPKENPEESEI
jgi:hypothetical protein